MRKKYKDRSREERRLATIRDRHGSDFVRKNASRAGKHSTTKFNSQTGKAAAHRKHELDRIRREEQAKEAREL